MRKPWMVVLLVASLLGPIIGWSTEPVDMSGNWLGTLHLAGSVPLRLVIRITRDALGALTARLDSPDQGAGDVPASHVILDGRRVTIVFPTIGGAYRGVLSEDGATLEGTWAQGPNAWPMPMARVAVAPGLPKRPQEPIPPYPYQTEEVRIPNPTAPGVALAGTLSFPRATGPFPAVVLITGSGPQDRDETLLGHRPFLVIADHLTRRGIAVLRMDDRGIGQSTGDFQQATSADFATDIAAGVRYLAARKEIDARRIGLIGHSEGGLIAPTVAAQYPAEIAFIVLLAGPGLRGDEILAKQSELIARAQGASEENIAINLRIQRRGLAILRQETDAGRMMTAMRAMLAEEMVTLSEAQRRQFAVPDEELARRVKEGATPWMRYFLNYDPLLTLARVRCPVLAMNGEKDLQVPYRESLAGILTGLAQAAREGGTLDVTILPLPGLNHLFQHCDTGLPNEYSVIEETFSPVALSAMGDWICGRVGIAP